MLVLKRSFAFRHHGLATLSRCFRHCAAGALALTTLQRLEVLELDLDCDVATSLASTLPALRRQVQCRTAPLQPRFATNTLRPL